MSSLIKKIFQNKFLVVCVCLYIIIVGTVSVLRHYQYQTQAWDLGIFEQTMWNTVNGRIMQNSLEEIQNHLGVHMSPFLFLLIPLYVFFQIPYFLIIVQTLALALAAIPLYFFTKEKLNNIWLIRAITLSYLLHPSLHSLNLFDFHPVAFFIPFVFSAFYFFEKKNFFWVWIFMLLAASTKEDSALICVSITLFWLLSAVLKVENKKIRLRKINKQIKKIINLFIFLLLYFLVSAKFIMPHFGGGLVRLDRYTHLGNGFVEMAKNIITNPLLFFKTIFTMEKMKYVFFLLLPIVFLPLFSVSSIFLVLPGILENILTNYDVQFSGLYQYDAVVLAGLYISSVYGVLFLLQKIKKEKIFIYLILLASVLSFCLSSQLAPKSFPIELFKKSAYTESCRKIVKEIPDDKSVAAFTNLVPHLAHRNYIRMVGNEEFFTDIVIIDRFDKFGFGTDEQFQTYFDAKINSGLYDMTVIDDRYIILKKK